MTAAAKPRVVAAEVFEQVVRTDLLGAATVAITALGRFRAQRPEC
jgi:hypothetical protein